MGGEHTCKAQTAPKRTEEIPSSEVVSHELKENYDEIFRYVRENPLKGNVFFKKNPM